MMNSARDRFVVAIRHWPGELALVDCVVDLDPLGELIGIEVLGLAEQVPRLAAALSSGPEVRATGQVSYDPEADALYVLQREGRSVSQRSGIAALVYDEHGNLLAIGVNFGPI